jgi:hypothetical protein
MFGALGRYVSSMGNDWVIGLPNRCIQEESRLRSRLPSNPWAVSIGVLLSRIPYQHRQARQNDARGPSYRAALGSTYKPKVCPGPKVDELCGIVGRRRQTQRPSSLAVRRAIRVTSHGSLPAASHSSGDMANSG